MRVKAGGFRFCVPELFYREESWALSHEGHRTCHRSGELKNLGLELATFQSDLSHAHGQLESLRSGAPGIEVHYSVSHLLLGLMRLTADHSCKARTLGVQIEQVEISESRKCVFHRVRQVQ